MVIIKELVKQMMEYTDVKVQEVKDHFTDEIKQRDVKISELVD